MEKGLSAAEYLNQLLEDKTTVSKMPKIFLHSERLLDEEINRVRNELFSPSSSSNPHTSHDVNSPCNTVVKVTEKVFARVKDYPKFNFVGRILGPRGLTLRQVEQETGAKLLVRGSGSMKDKALEEEKRHQPNYEHLEEDLHVLVMVEDIEERARLKLHKAVEEVTFLLTPPRTGEDDIKKKQLQDLAILNGTYRPPSNGDNSLNVSINGMSHNNFFNFPNSSAVLAPNSPSYPSRRHSTTDSPPCMSSWFS